jgi:uncharacterized protein YhbP (UPF0306 family)
MQAKNRKLVLDYLKLNRLMTLSTVSGTRPWSATVFFAYDTKANIFFYSRPDTKHSTHILKNPYVAIVINHDAGTKGRVKGMQIVGRAKLVPRKDLKKSYALYRKRFPWADEYAADHRLYVVRPSEIHYVDHKHFGHFFRVKMK